jgi:hypothetical protein
MFNKGRRLGDLIMSKKYIINSEAFNDLIDITRSYKKELLRLDNGKNEYEQGYSHCLIKIIVSLNSFLTNCEINIHNNE